LLFKRFFSDCRYMPQLRRYSSTKLCDSAQMANIWRFFMVALWNRAVYYILSCFFYLSLFFSLPNLNRWRLDANLECRTETCCTWLAGNAGPKKLPKMRNLGTIAQLYRAISSQLRHILTIGKNLLNSNMSSRCPHNLVNFGLLAAEICWRV